MYLKKFLIIFDSSRGAFIQMEKKYKILIEKAMSAREKSYSPYSGFRVGACIETEDGLFFTGCNIENSSYPVTNCAERTAIFKAVSEGYTKFKRIAIVGGKDAVEEFCPPCGMCRQTMMEFCDADTFEVVLAKKDEYKIIKLKDLFPFEFTL